MVLGKRKAKIVVKLFFFFVKIASNIADHVSYKHISKPGRHKYLSNPLRKTSRWECGLVRAHLRNNTKSVRPAEALCVQQHSS